MCVRARACVTEQLKNEHTFSIIIVITNSHDIKDRRTFLYMILKNRRVFLYMILKNRRVVTSNSSTINNVYETQTFNHINDTKNRREVITLTLSETCV